MKPSTAFAVGLWTGAAVVAAVGAFNWHTWMRNRGDTSPRVTAALLAKDEEIQRLQRDQARGFAEEQRLRETIADLKRDLARRSLLEERRQARRQPGSSEESTTPAGVKGEQWIADAVVREDGGALPRLEMAALQDDPFALEALALLAQRDSGAALLRLCAAPQLKLPTRIKAVRYLAATLELNPQAEEWLRALFATPEVDIRLLYAATTGLVSPGFASALAAQDQRISPPPRWRPDFVLRLRLLNAMRDQVADENLRAHMDQARDQLLSRLPQTAR